jgi:isoquinoline 1-oxidoreductase beta subunit
VFGGKAVSFDGSEAMKVPGVLKVVAIDPPAIPSEFQPLGGVAVVARNTHAAMKGRDALKITWEDGPNASYSSDTYRAALEEAARKPAKVVRNEGDVDKAMAGAAKKVEAEYYIPHLAQAPLEPPAALVRIVDGRCEAWACTQAPQVTRTRLAQRLGIPEDRVTVNVTLLGGGFGRKSKPDFVIEAGLCSKAMDGAPVKVTWTREDDLHHGFYHTGLRGAARGGAGRFRQARRVAAPERGATIGSIFAADLKHELPFELGMGLVNTPFVIPNIRAENPEAQAHARIGWFRAVSNIPHAFAIQSFVAELAHAAGRDPKDYLLELIGPPGSWTRSRSATCGTTARTRSATRSTPGASGAWWKRRRPGSAGGDRCHPEGASASPATTASSPTSRSRRRWRWTGAAGSPSRAWTSPWTAARR